MLLDHLACLYRDQPSPQREVELWRVRKDQRELRCVAIYLPVGIDVRLMERDGFRRTRLVRDSIETETVSHQWRTALLEHGWKERQANAST
jgi:hypothetical protein